MDKNPFLLSNCMFLSTKTANISVLKSLNFFFMKADNRSLIPLAAMYGGFVVVTWYFCASTLPCAINCFSSSAVSSSPTVSMLSWPTTSLLDTKRSNSSQSYCSTVRIEPYSLASLKASRSPVICVTALFFSNSLRPTPKYLSWFRSIPLLSWMEYTFGLYSPFRIRRLYCRAFIMTAKYAIWKARSSISRP